jgi:hypothetical protein
MKRHIYIYIAKNNLWNSEKLLLWKEMSSISTKESKTAAEMQT